MDKGEKGGEWGVAAPCVAGNLNLRPGNVVGLF